MPENVGNSSASVSDSPTHSSGFRVAAAAASNLPRHILQRKQVEKLNRRKIVSEEEETLEDKENHKE